MKQLNLFLPIIFLAGLFFACSGSNTSNKNNSNISDASQPSNTSGKASFSANVDGVNISGGEIDNMQIQNTAFIYPTADNSGKRLLFFLRSDKNGDVVYFFRFSVPDKTGTFTKKDSDDKPFSITLDFLGGDNSRYNADDVTVNIISVTASKVTGTFSGKFTLSVDTPRGVKKEVTVTDGKFDIPFSTGNVRPE